MSPQMSNVVTLRGKLAEMRENRDYWEGRAKAAESELRIAARCVRALLSKRKAAAKWLSEFESE